MPLDLPQLQSAASITNLSSQNDAVITANFTKQSLGIILPQRQSAVSTVCSILLYRCTGRSAAKPILLLLNIRSQWCCNSVMQWLVFCLQTLLAFHSVLDRPLNMNSFRHSQNHNKGRHGFGTLVLAMSSVLS